MNKLLKLAALTSVLTFVLLLIGGTVNPTGSSLACPDWPTCYGSFMPEMTGGVEYEHTHRIAATLVGLFTMILAGAAWRSKTVPKRTKRLTLLALFLVILQGVLGGVTVLLRLPTAVSVGHLGISMVFFCLTILIVFQLWQAQRGAPSSHSIKWTSRRTWVALAALAVFLQILLGALTRHTGAGRACGDALPFCTDGYLWPALGPAKLHMAHRIAGVAVAIFVMVIGLWVARLEKQRGDTLSRGLALVAPVAVVFQVGLGVLTVITFVGLVPVTAHLGLGAFLLADLLVLFLALGRTPDEARVVPARAVSAGSARVKGGATA